MQIPAVIYIRALNLLLTVPFIAVLLTVFVVNQEFNNSIIIGKYFWFYGSMFFVAVITPVIYFINRKRIQITVIDCFVALLAASTLLSAIVFNGNLHTNKIVTFTMFVALYFFFRVLFSQCENSVKIIMFALIITALAEAVMGLMQLYGFAYSNHSLFKTTGTFHNPGPYAGYLAIIFPIALHWSLDFMKKRTGLKTVTVSSESKKIPYRIAWSDLYTYIVGILSIFAVVSIFLILPASMSRASWLALFFGSSAVIFFYYYKKTNIWIICISAIILALCFSKMYNLKKDSADGRMLMWKVSVYAAVQNPSGTGLGHFPEAYGKAQSGYFSSKKASAQEENVAGNPEYAFNEYLQICVESGIISLVLYIVLIIYAMLKTLKNRQYGMFGAFISLSVFAFFSYPFSMAPHLVLLVSFLAVAASGTNNNSKENLCGLFLKGSVLFSFTIIAVFCLINRYPVYKAYKEWNNNINYGLSENMPESYESLFPVLKDDINFLFEYAQYLAGLKEYRQSNVILQRALQIGCDPMLHNIMGKNYQSLKQYDLAEKSFATSALLVPSLLYPHYLLANMYNEMGDTAKAVKTANIVLTKEPKIYSPAIDEMRHEAKKIINANKTPDL